MTIFALSPIFCYVMNDSKFCFKVGTIIKQCLKNIENVVYIAIVKIKQARYTYNGDLQIEEEIYRSIYRYIR